MPAGPADTFEGTSGGQHGACRKVRRLAVLVVDIRYTRDIATPLRGPIAFDNHSRQRSSTTAPGTQPAGATLHRLRPRVREAADSTPNVMFGCGPKRQRMMSAQMSAMGTS